MEAKREEIIRHLFSMWLDKKDKGLTEVFTPDGEFIESCGLMYHGSETIARWFADWNAEQTMVEWTIKQFFHKGNQTVVEWHFRYETNDGGGEGFDGLTRFEWTEDNRIIRLKEFVSQENPVDPYQK